MNYLKLLSISLFITVICSCSSSTDIDHLKIYFDGKNKSKVRAVEGYKSSKFSQFDLVGNERIWEEVVYHENGNIKDSVSYSYAKYDDQRIARYYYFNENGIMTKSVKTNYFKPDSPYKLHIEYEGKLIAIDKDSTTESFNDDGGLEYMVQIVNDKYKFTHKITKEDYGTRIVHTGPLGDIISDDSNYTSTDDRHTINNLDGSKTRMNVSFRDTFKFDSKTYFVASSGSSFDIIEEVEGNKEESLQTHYRATTLDTSNLLYNLKEWECKKIEARKKVDDILVAKTIYDCRNNVIESLLISRKSDKSKNIEIKFFEKGKLVRKEVEKLDYRGKYIESNSYDFGSGKISVDKYVYSKVGLLDSVLNFENGQLIGYAVEKYLK